MKGHPACGSPAELLADCQVTRGRRSGPGGQHRNKVETAIVIEHLASGIRGEATEKRSQAENQAVALQRLRVNLALGLRSQATPVESPGAAPDVAWHQPAWERHRVGRQLRINVDHPDFPTLLADALDLLADHSGDVAAVASLLRVSNSQLLKLLKRDYRALLLANRMRQSNGLPPLK